MKICNKCKTPKEKEEFHKNDKAPDGRQNVCRTCRKEENEKIKKVDWIKQFVIG